MPQYLARHLETVFNDYRRHFKIVLVTGARQVGKSTMLMHLLPEIRSFVFDPVQDLYGARRDPDLFLDSNPPPLILDEVQFAPELLPSIKRRVDQEEQPGRYFLSGSQNLAMLRSVAESMAGRVGIINLEGMTPFELAGKPETAWLEHYLLHPESLSEALAADPSAYPNSPNLMTTLWRGSLPGLLEMPDSLVPGYFRSYIQTYVERDVRLLENIRELAAFDRFLGLSAALSAQEINASQLGREVGITPASARRWLDLLTHTFQWLEIFPYHGNTIKRVSGKRKGYWRDTGLACHLQRISSPQALAVSPLLGPLFETWQVNTINRMAQQLPTPPQLYHWRTSGGAEVDLIMERDGRLFPVEFKAKSHPGLNDTRGLRAFRETYGTDKVAPGLLIHAGHEIYQLDRHTLAIPWNAEFRKATP